MAAIRDSAPATETIALAIYLRVSSQEQRDQGTIETQRAAADRYVRLQDITPYGWYADDGVSGTIPFAERPEGRRLLADVAAGHINAVLVWKLNRLGRNALGVLRAVEAFEQAGVRLICITESFDTSTPAGRLQLNMLAGIAQFDRDNILENTAEGMDRRLREQKWMGGRVSYGYRAEGARREAHLALDEEEASVVRLVYHLYVDERRSLQGVADVLNSKSVPTQFVRVGRPYRMGTTIRPALGIWRPSSVRRLLMNPVYKGEVVYGRKSTTRAIVELPAPAIVEAEVWEAAQQRLTTAQQHAGGHNATHPYLLRGLITCARCGRLFTAQCIMSSKDGKPHPIHYYMCNGKRRARTLFDHDMLADERCQSPTLNANWLDTTVWAAVAHYVVHREETLALIALRLRGQADQQEAFRDELARLERDRAAKQSEKDKVIALFRRDRITERELDHQLDDLAREEAEIADQIARLTERTQQARETEEQLMGAAAHLDWLRARWDTEAHTPAFKREIVEGLVAGVAVDQEEIGTTRRGSPKTGAVVSIRYKFSDPAHAARHGGEYHMARSMLRHG